MHIKGTIDNFLEIKGKKKEDLAALLDTSTSNLYYKLRNNAFTLKEIEQMCSFFNVDISDFFTPGSKPVALLHETRTKYSSNNVQLLQSEIDSLKSLLEILEKRVNML